MSPRLQIALAAVLFSTGGAAIKWVDLGGWQLAAFRAGIAFLTLLALVPESRRGWTWRAALVGCAYAATTLLYVQANIHTTAASAIFLQNTNPVIILALAPWLLGEHSSRRDLVQLAVMAPGLVLLFVGLDRPSATAPNPALGNALAAACAVTWAFTLMGYRWLVARGGGGGGGGSASVATAAASGNLMATVVALVLAVPLAAGRPADWLALAFLGVCQLGVPYVFMVRAIPRLRALEVALFMLIEPVLNPIWAWLVHGEAPGLATLLGGAIILGATALRALIDARVPAR